MSTIEKENLKIFGGNMNNIPQYVSKCLEGIITPDVVNYFSRGVPQILIDRDKKVRSLYKPLIDYFLANISSVGMRTPNGWMAINVGLAVPTDGVEDTKYTKWVDSIVAKGKPDSKIELFWFMALMKYKTNFNIQYDNDAQAVIDNWLKDNKLVDFSVGKTDSSGLITNPFNLYNRYMFWTKITNWCSILTNGYKVIPIYKSIHDVITLKQPPTSLISDDVKNYLISQNKNIASDFEPSSPNFQKAITNIIFELIQRSQEKVAYVFNVQTDDVPYGYLMDKILTDNLTILWDRKNIRYPNYGYTSAVFAPIAVVDIKYARNQVNTFPFSPNHDFTSVFTNFVPDQYFTTLQSINPNAPIQAMKDFQSYFKFMSLIDSDIVKGLFANNKTILDAFSSFHETNKVLLNNGKVNKDSLINLRKVFNNNFGAANPSQINSYLSKNLFATAYYVLGYPFIIDLKLNFENMEMVSEQPIHFKDRTSFDGIKKNQLQIYFEQYFSKDLVSKSVSKLGKKYDISSLPKSDSNFYSPLLNCYYTLSSYYWFSQSFGDEKGQGQSFKDMLDIITAMIIERNKVTISSNEFLLAFNEVNDVYDLQSKQKVYDSMNKFFTGSMKAQIDYSSIFKKLIDDLQSINDSFDFAVRSLGEATGKFYQEAQASDYIDSKVIKEVKQLQPTVEVHQTLQPIQETETPVQVEEKVSPQDDVSLNEVLNSQQSKMSNKKKLGIAAAVASVIYFINS